MKAVAPLLLTLGVLALGFCFLAVLGNVILEPLAELLQTMEGAADPFSR